MNRWVTQGYSTEWGVNVPSKDFGERVEVEHHVPEISATELHERIERGDELVILDTRTPEEYRRFCIPGGRSVPGGELALRITDITKNLSNDATVIVNCAGRTRSIIGTRVLQRMGMTNVYGLENGTAGWLLAGLDLETGADRVALPEPSAEGVAAAEAYADRLVAEDGVQYLDVEALRQLMDRRGVENVYLLDIRRREEYTKGHIPGFQWFPGGQAVQRSDEVAVVKNCPIVFCCDGRARAVQTASWYRQMGFREVYAVGGGTAAWTGADLALDEGVGSPEPFGLADARDKVRLVSPEQARNHAGAAIIDVGTSADFSGGHLPGARWVPRGWLEFQIEGLAPPNDQDVLVTCTDGLSSTLAGATLTELGYIDVSVLDGGKDAWRSQGFDLETGLAGVMTPPTDMVPAGIDRNYADMVTYLRWETALGEKYEK